MMVVPWYNQVWGDDMMEPAWRHLVPFYFFLRAAHWVCHGCFLFWHLLVGGVGWILDVERVVLGLTILFIYGLYIEHHFHRVPLLFILFNFFNFHLDLLAYRLQVEVWDLPRLLRLKVLNCLDWMNRLVVDIGSDHNSSVVLVGAWPVIALRCPPAS